MLDTCYITGMRLLAVNLGQPQPIQRGNCETQTGIFKHPTSARVPVGKLGLAGDQQVAREHHGGVDQAVYVYSAADYAWWAKQLGRALEPGTFGENLTVTEFGASTLYIGDRWQIGDVLLEITAPRIPCATLAARMEDAGFVKRFKVAERPGAYARVLQTGQVQVGDTFTYHRGTSDVTVLEVFRLHYEKTLSHETIQRILSAPIAIRGRRAYEAMLASSD